MGYWKRKGGEEEGIGFRTGTVRVGKVRTAPVPVNTAPAKGTGTHRNRFAAVFLNNRGFTCTRGFFISILLYFILELWYMHCI